MGIKYIEYSHKIHEGLLPGKLFSYTDATQNLGLYFSFYYSMTGLHGSHVLAGMIFILWLAIRSHRKHFGPGYVLPLECVGLFWHLVDLTLDLFISLALLNRIKLKRGKKCQIILYHLKLI